MADDEDTPTLPAIISRAEAMAAGLKRYFLGTDRPCPKGHIAERVVINGACVVCSRTKSAAWHEANRDHAKAYQAAWYEANAEQQRAYARDYYKNNYEKARSFVDKWQKDNPEKVREINRNRRARKRAAEGFHTIEDVQRIYAVQRGKCACCKEKVGEKYHVDHIQPLSRGGSNWPANLQILCGPCNIRKKDKDPAEFMRSLGFLL